MDRFSHPSERIFHSRSITMRYQPPAIAMTLNATSSIQSVGRENQDKNPHNVPDVAPGTIPCTSGAYEADE